MPHIDSNAHKTPAAMYYLTIYAGDDLVEERVAYQDYAEAIAACGPYYEPRSKGAALTFSSVVVGKKFMRSYAQLKRLEDLDENVDRTSPQVWKATKDGNAFVYSESYSFLIESELGVKEADRMRVEDAEE